MSGYRTVIVGTDGSASSMRAVERAAEVAAHDNARLIVASAHTHAAEKGGWSRFHRLITSPTPAPPTPSAARATSCTGMPPYTKYFERRASGRRPLVPRPSRSGRSRAHQSMH